MTPKHFQEACLPEDASRNCDPNNVTPPYSLAQVQHCPRAVPFKRCNLAHALREIYRGAESAAAAAAAATAASSYASTATMVVVFLSVNHVFLTMRGLWCDCGRHFVKPQTTAQDTVTCSDGQSRNP